MLELRFVGHRRGRAHGRGARGARRPRGPSCCARPTRSCPSGRSWPCPGCARPWPRRGPVASRSAAVSPIVGGRGAQGTRGPDAGRAGPRGERRRASPGCTPDLCDVFVLDAVDARARRRGRGARDATAGDRHDHGRRRVPRPARGRGARGGRAERRRPPMDPVSAQIRGVMAALEARDAADRADGTPQARRLRAISPEVGPFLVTLALAVGARTIVEIGHQRRVLDPVARGGGTPDRRAGGHVRGGRGQGGARPGDVRDAGVDDVVELRPADGVAGLGVVPRLGRSRVPRRREGRLPAGARARRSRRCGRAACSSPTT